MASFLPKKSTVFLAIISASMLALTSCEKMAGKELVTTTKTNTTTTSGSSTTSGGSTGTFTGDGVGPVAVGGTNTIILKIGSGAEQTFSAPSYFLGINSLPVFMGTGYSTDISTFDMFSTVYFILGYENSVPGTYKVNSFHFTATGVDLQQTGATSTLKTKVVAESIHVSNTQTNEAAGTVKGTFDGYVTNTKSATSDSVRVSGSFNLSK